MTAELIAGTALLGLGLTMLARALRSRRRRVALLRDCVRAVGRVIHFEDTTQPDVALGLLTWHKWSN